VDTLIENFIVPIVSRNEAIKCITEIAALTFDGMSANDARICKLKLCGFYCCFVRKINELTKGRSLLDEYQNAKQSR
jgi:hypothetical protein